MNPFLQPATGTGINPTSHAHLLAMESGGQCVLETPEEVINEVVFRATYVTALMEEMFREAESQDKWEVDEV